MPRFEVIVDLQRRRSSFNLETVNHDHIVTSYVLFVLVALTHIQPVLVEAFELKPPEVHFVVVLGDDLVEQFGLFLGQFVLLPLHLYFYFSLQLHLPFCSFLRPVGPRVPWTPWSRVGCIGEGQFVECVLGQELLVSLVALLLPRSQEFLVHWQTFIVVSNFGVGEHEGVRFRHLGRTRMWFLVGIEMLNDLSIVPFQG